MKQHTIKMDHFQFKFDYVQCVTRPSATNPHAALQGRDPVSEAGLEQSGLTLLMKWKHFKTAPKIMHPHIVKSY